VTHHGHHYTVEHARLYSKPDQPIPVYVSAFGPEAIDLAGRIGDGYVSTAPSSESVAAFNEAGGRGKPKQAGAKVCYGPDRDEAVKTAHRLWPTNGLAGQLSQDLRTPEHFMQATQNVTVEQIGSNLPCGPDLQIHHDAIRAYVDARFDEVLISQIGPLQEEFFRFAAQELLPSLRDG
jgi:G6PDH family F420-dependent oxidoreductase